MERKELEVYSEATSQAVIRPPGRRFPGSVIQGDSLSILCSLAKSIHERATVTKDQQLIEDATELLDLLITRQKHYEQVLRAHHIELPYVKES
jgi:hypothetical protein